MDKMDRENSCESMQLFAPKTQQFNLIFSGSPVPAGLGQGHAGQQPWEERCSGTLLLPPRLQALFPSPDQVPPALFRQAWSSGSATSAVINGAGPDGCLPELDMFPPVAKLCLWYMCFCAEVFFSVLTLYSSMEHSLGVKKKKFSFLSSCNAVIFFNSLSSCPVYPLVCMLCMGRWMAYFTGTCD